MNLHGIVRGAITTVNPDIPITILKSTGVYVTEDDGTRVPQYLTIPNVPAQVQPVDSKDLKHLDALNIQGEFRSVHLNGDWHGVLRPDGKGGELFKWAGQTYLVVQVPETWPDWCRVIVARQMDPV